jgi:iron transport multicopper oxidase
MGDAGPYVPQKVPTLYTAITTGELNTNPVVYGHVHPLIVSFDQTVDIVVNNHDGAIHPFHLHGHHFQVLERPGSGAGTWSPPPSNDTSSRYNQNPPMRDTVSVFGQSYAVLRFKADNPGVYLFHCHIEWHVEMGLTATVIEAPEMLRSYRIPEDQLNSCKALGIPYQGNAGGDIVNLLETSNYNTLNEYPYDGLVRHPFSFWELSNIWQTYYRRKWAYSQTAYTQATHSPSLVEEERYQPL